MCVLSTKPCSTPVLPPVPACRPYLYCSYLLAAACFPYIIVKVGAMLQQHRCLYRAAVATQLISRLCVAFNFTTPATVLPCTTDDSFSVLD
jgi:hypothetical protein